MNVQNEKYYEDPENYMPPPKKPWWKTLTDEELREEFYETAGSWAAMRGDIFPEYEMPQKLIWQMKLIEEFLSRELGKSNAEIQWAIHAIFTWGMMQGQKEMLVTSGKDD